MLIPYGTDAPIYHFPRMTIVLIVANAIAFVITGMGVNSEGWMLTYGRGLHPTEWVMYSFLHFGPVHLVGNMFFLWAFGIVVEGKLGWRNFLILYLSIGIIGGILIQTAMLGHVSMNSVVDREPPAKSWIWQENAVFAQVFDDGKNNDDFPLLPDLKDAGRGNLPPGFDPRAGGANKGEREEEPLPVHQDGAGGASLIIYALMAVVLVWAPRNEVYCAWIFGFRAGTIEIEYLYFCGFYIATEVVSAIFSAEGFEVTSEVGHATGAIIGFGLGTLMVKKKWVDCENWDVYSIMNGKHGAAMRVGDWQNNVIVHASRKEDWVDVASKTESDFSDLVVKKNKKKAKPMPKLVELKSLDETFVDSDLQDEQTANSDPSVEPEVPPFADDEEAASPPSPPVVPPSRAKKKSRAAHSNRIRAKLFDGEFLSAFEEYGELRDSDETFYLTEGELRVLAEGLFKAKEADKAAPLFEEYIARYPDDADSQRIKLSVLFVKFLRRPKAALMLLAKIKNQSLTEESRVIYSAAVSEAKRMTADGVVDRDY